ncbi:Short-chain dehydrogenase/reductase [Fulvia fulva]|nr:Short-chain dehydrogenase/reductase [Fulvia fulva]WPV21622.1 Short-chain dehydrogenase/reductase [Fulvia fulva]WPV35804.1 Short-chain dehydrogenase/reductase [Fulvia fulva]
MGSIWSQSVLISAPALTVAKLPDQFGKVVVVTGGYSGIGSELAEMLYSRNATVFIAGRDVQQAKKCMQGIQTKHASSSGRLEYLHLDLADMVSIRRAGEDFLARSDRLDVLVNNAGVMTPAVGSKTAQGYELQLGVNCLGPHLFTQLVMPRLLQTAETAPAGSVRVLWAGSVAVELAPRAGMSWTEGVDAAPVTSSDQASNYSISKTGNVLLAMETARRYGKRGIISVAYNPGNLRTGLQRHMAWWQYMVARMVLYSPHLGACTVLFAGWSDAVTFALNGAYVWPWGRVGSLRKDILQATQPIDCGGCAVGERFWLWCERVTQA